MNGTPRARPRAGRFGPIPKSAIAGSLGIAAAAVWAGCTVTESNYKILSFFFDGVPDPNAVTAETGGAGGGGRGGSGGGRGAVYLHPPFKERNCKACHVGAGSFGLTFSGYSDVSTKVCFECHPGVLEEFPWIHGPVRVEDCLWCHQAHQSRFEPLLKAPPPALCLGCHALGRIEERTADHVDLSRNCLDCHHGHGGETKDMLREPSNRREGGDAAATPAGAGAG